MGTDKIIWETEGDQIKPEAAIALIYKNSLIDSFLEPHNKHFIVAAKGLGKTLTLKTKRFMLEKSTKKKSGNDRFTQSPNIFVPSDTPYLDVLGNLSTLDGSKINVLSDNTMATKIWEFSIQLSALTVAAARTKHKIFPDLMKVLPAFITGYINNNIELSPCSVLGLVLGNSVSTINRIIDGHFADVFISYKDVHTPMYFFIDRVDHAFFEYGEKVWNSMQTALMEAAWNCMGANHQPYQNICFASDRGIQEP